MHDAAISLPSPQPWTIVRQPPDLEQVASRHIDPVYRFLYGYSIQDTAQGMGITPENAKVIQHRALAKALQVGEGLL